MARRTGIIAEFWMFVKTNKAWVLAPIIVFLLLLIAFIVLGSTSAAPFIYTMF